MLSSRIEKVSHLVLMLCCRDAGQEFGVQGFPTIKFFRDGVAQVQTAAMQWHAACVDVLWLLLSVLMVYGCC